MRFVARTGAQTGRSDSKRPLVDTVARLKKLGIEYQLQLAQLVFLVLAALILQELVVRDKLQLARFGRTWHRNTRWRSGGGQRSDRSFPPTEVARKTFVLLANEKSPISASLFETGQGRRLGR